MEGATAMIILLIRVANPAILAESYLRKYGHIE
jgi:hypothetical protein